MIDCSVCSSNLNLVYISAENQPITELFRCDNGASVNMSSRCDGNADCGDGSDEVSCDLSSTMQCKVQRPPSTMIICFHIAREQPGNGMGYLTILLKVPL